MDFLESYLTISLLANKNYSRRISNFNGLSVDYCEGIILKHHITKFDKKKIFFNFNFELNEKTFMEELENIIQDYISYSINHCNNYYDFSFTLNFISEKNVSYFSIN